MSQHADPVRGRNLAKQLADVRSWAEERQLAPHGDVHHVVAVLVLDPRDQQQPRRPAAAQASMYSSYRRSVQPRLCSHISATS